MIIKLSFTLVLLACTGVAIAAQPLAGDPAAGRKVFRQKCLLCHSAEASDSGGALGPDLHDSFGRAAASVPGFGYTQALKDSKLVWDAATLDRFLEAPTRVVPGTNMAVAVPDAAERANLVAYLRSSGQGQSADGVQSPDGTGTAAASARTRGTLSTATKAGADWKNDRPGRVHHIVATQLARPYATESARKSPGVVARPQDAKLAVPQGFNVEVFASDLKSPRVMRVAPNGDVFLSEPDVGRITALRPSADFFKAAAIETFADGLDQPYGLQFYPAGDDPKWLYVAEVNRVLRYAYTKGDRKARGQPEVVVAKLAPQAQGGHSTRDLLFSADGRRMFVSVGSESNVAEEMSKKTPAQIKEWDAQRGVGATWDTEENRADVLVFDTSLPGVAKVFATGIRNCVGLTLQPGTGDIWCTTNERDRLGDDLVPDYSTRVKEGGFYGWPWYYLGNNEDPRHKGARPDLAGKAIVPDVLYTSHSAALHLTFYQASNGKSAFPKEYVGEGFATLHGSWNRAFRTGHKVVRVRMSNGVPTGEYEDFLTGFIVDDNSVWGRPADIAQLADGSLLMSDDGGNLIYRISYSP